MIEKKGTKLPELKIDDGALEDFIGSDRYYKWEDKRRKQIETSRAKQTGMDSYYQSIAKALSGECRDRVCMICNYNHGSIYVQNARRTSCGAPAKSDILHQICPGAEPVSERNRQCLFFWSSCMYRSGYAINVLYARVPAIIL